MEVNQQNQVSLSRVDVTSIDATNPVVRTSLTTRQPRPHRITPSRAEHGNSWKAGTRRRKEITPLSENQSYVSSLSDGINGLSASGQEFDFSRSVAGKPASLSLEQSVCAPDSAAQELPGCVKSSYSPSTRRNTIDSKQDPACGSVSSTCSPDWRLQSSSDGLSCLSAEESCRLADKPVGFRERTRKNRKNYSRTKTRGSGGCKLDIQSSFSSSSDSYETEMGVAGQEDEIAMRSADAINNDVVQQQPDEVDKQSVSTNRESSSSASNTPSDPWVRPETLSNTSRVHFAATETPGSRTVQTVSDSLASSPPGGTLRAESNYAFHESNSPSRTDSQNELDRVVFNRDASAHYPDRGQANGNSELRQRLRNDLDLLSRPSWCDAKFALSRIDQGKAKGNRHALRLRSYLHRFLFWLGCYIQEWALTVAFVGMLLLAACCVGLKTAHMETDIEKLWVEAGGVLEKEIAYSKSQMSGSGFSMQMLIQTGANTATIDSLKLHLEAAQQATKVSVHMYNQTWTFDDVCYKETPSAASEEEQIVVDVLRNLFPCFIIGPLDCFWDGAKLLGPRIPITTIERLPDFTWKNLDPMTVVDAFLDGNTDKNSKFYKTIKRYKDMMVEAGIESGYLDRWCLDPTEPDCPETAPNYRSRELPNVTQLLQAGCTGFATKLMKWPLDLIVGGIKRDSRENVVSARGLQTLFQLMSADNLFEYHNTFRTAGILWNKDKAQEILYAWQRKFVKTVYKVLPNDDSESETDSLFAFSVATASDILKKFTNISVIRVAGGYLVMMGYAFIALMRLRASRSQSAVGVIGVLLVALSVAAGLGIASWIGISFNAASTQVLPFLMLGLGVDDMFLMAHHFGEIAVLSYIPFEERTGECLKRVGVSVVLTSIAILSGFLFSLVIPMPALRAFGFQAAIVTVFNLVSVLCIFPAVLSIDLKRRKNNKYDVLCCIKSSSPSEVIDLSEQNEPSPPRCQCHHHHHHYHHHHHHHHQQYSHTRNVPLPASSHTDFAPESPMSDNAGTAITMHHSVQAYANSSYATVLGPAAETSFNTPANPEADRTHYPGTVPSYYSPARTPPPVYTPHDEAANKRPPSQPKVAFVDTTESSPSTVSTPGRMMTNRSAVTPISSARGGKNSGSTPSTNLTTPMESVRSSTRSLVHRRHKRSFLCFASSGRRSGDWYARLEVMKSLTLSHLGERYYSPFLTKNPVRIVTCLLFALLLGASVYGCTQVKDGLDLGDILPSGTREHEAIVTQAKYFSFYNMYIVTKEFDYASEQRNLYEMHDEISNISYVMKQTDGTSQKFWLHYFRDYLQSLQNSFDKDWVAGRVTEETWTPDATDNTVLAFKLLVQTGRADEPTDNARIGCDPPAVSRCERVNRVRLVSDDGLIPEDAFYNYLSVWVSNDPLSYAGSQAQLKPEPPSYEHDRSSANLIIPRASTIRYAQMPFYLNGMRGNEDFVNVIKSVRAICDTTSAETGIDVYPSGYPFTFWQQYIDLRFWLFISLASVIGAVFVVLSVVLFNPWAAGIMALFLVMITTELLGFMGWTGIKLSAVPAVILVASIGLGVEFTVHITFAFITSCGSRRDRVARSLGHMLGPVFDGSISTLLGVVMLSGSEFDFIVKYFFQVLAFLILLGVLNGLVLLPVLLSFIGPTAEVVPVGGGTRLKTPTPPPSPPAELDCDCPHCSNQHFRGNANGNNNNNVCLCVRCVQYRRYYGGNARGGPTSRDDMHACHATPRFRFPRDVKSHRARSYGAQSYYRDGGMYRNSLHQRRLAGGVHMRNAPSQYHPHAILPILEEEESMARATVNPQAQYVMYSARPDATYNQHPHIPHCETTESQLPFQPIRPETDFADAPDTVRPTPHVSRMNMTMVDCETDERIDLTLSSSLTVHTRGRPTKVVSFVEPGSMSSSTSGLMSSSTSGLRPDCVWQQQQPSHSGDLPTRRTTSLPHRRFDISALNDLGASGGGRTSGATQFRY